MTTNKSLLKSILSFALAITLFFSTSVMTGCSSKNAVVGTWLYTTDDGEIKDYGMSFYEDGTCLDTPVKSSAQGYAESYKIQDDGMLIFNMSWDGTKSYKPAEDKETALDDKDYYYLSNDTFILCKRTYTKK